MRCSIRSCKDKRGFELDNGLDLCEFHYRMLFNDFPKVQRIYCKDCDKIVFEVVSNGF